MQILGNVTCNFSTYPGQPKQILSPSLCTVHTRAGQHLRPVRKFENDRYVVSSAANTGKVEYLNFEIEQANLERFEISNRTPPNCQTVRTSELNVCIRKSSNFRTSNSLNCKFNALVASSKRQVFTKSAAKFYERPDTYSSSVRQRLRFKGWSFTRLTLRSMLFGGKEKKSVLAKRSTALDEIKVHKVGKIV